MTETKPLTELETQVSRLCLEERLTSKEIAQRLGISGTAVAKARQRVRAKGAQLAQHSRTARDKPLSDRQIRAVSVYVTGKSKLAAYRAVTENPNASSGDAARFFNDPRVAEEIERQRQLIRERVPFDVLQSMAELDRGLQLAEETKNATAYARCCEIRAKLYSLIELKQTITIEQPDLLRALQMAESRLERAGLRPPIDVQDVVEVRPAIAAPSVLD